MATMTTTKLTELATRINATAARAEEHILAGLEAARACGELLIEAKGQVPHGGWGDWLAEKLGPSRSLSFRFLQISSLIVATMALAISLVEVPAGWWEE